MKYSETFPSASSYLKAQDIPAGREAAVTISGVEVATLDGEDSKPALSFAGKERQLLLNRTNAAALVDAFGDEMDSWVGKQIVLFRMMVTFQGRQVPAIRIRIPPQQQPQQPAMQPQQAAQAPAGEPNDDIPW